MQTLTIRRLSFGSIFKIGLAGFGCIITPFVLIIGILNYLGYGSFTVEGDPIHGPMILVHTLWVSVVMPVWFAFFFGGLIFLGQLIYGKFRTFTIKVVQD